MAELRIAPNLPLSMLYQGAVVAVFALVIASSLWLVKALTGQDVIVVLVESLSEIGAMAQLEGFALFGLILAQLRQTVGMVLIEGVALTLLLQIPVFNLELTASDTQLRYRKGTILVREGAIPLEAVVSVTFERHVPWLDFGKVQVQIASGEHRLVEIPYVPHVGSISSELYERVSEFRRRNEKAPPGDARQQESAGPPGPAPQSAGPR
ncbi:hypothetical protein J4439_07910 [Candidatus Woesearchaeota archaeon]|nr:hypothetical protein [Candidatus Woesearchaeota archaeon]